MTLDSEKYGKEVDPPRNHNIWPNVGLMVGHRVRRWPYINPTLGQNDVSYLLGSTLSYHTCIDLQTDNLG